MEAQLLNLLSQRFHWASQELLALFRVLPMDASGSMVFFYHPIITTGSSAFETFVLTEDMYEFIDGQLKLKGEEFFSWFEEELKKK